MTKTLATLRGHVTGAYWRSFGDIREVLWMVARPPQRAKALDGSGLLRNGVPITYSINYLLPVGTAQVDTSSAM